MQAHTPMCSRLTALPQSSPWILTSSRRRLPASPKQNRVTPFSELIAVSERGTFMGNRGLLHDDAQRIVRFNQGGRWIICVTHVEGRRRVPMTPGLYTELFFLDEATALAAGHRPCMACRHPEAQRFRAAWAEGAGEDPAISFEELDRRLHEERLAGRGVMRRWRVEGRALPDGAMVAREGDAFLVHGGELLRWSPAGYSDPQPFRGVVEVLTPRSIVGAIAAGYAPALHPSA